MRLIHFVAACAVSCAFFAFVPGGSPSVGSGETVVSYGERINIEDHIQKGKTVVFDFYSEYCPPCRRIAPLLAKLAAQDKGVSIVKVNINRRGMDKGIDWKSPVARQFGLESIPYFKIYDTQGRLAAEGKDAYDKLMEMLRKSGILKDF